MTAKETPKSAAEEKAVAEEEAGCGCGEEIFAILRRVRHLYVVALEQNKDDLATFRTTLVEAKGVVPVADMTDVFAMVSWRQEADNIIDRYVTDESARRLDKRYVLDSLVVGPNHEQGRQGAAGGAGRDCLGVFQPFQPARRWALAQSRAGGGGCRRVPGRLPGRDDSRRRSTVTCSRTFLR
jgi:hypothetical protein